jgi:hypothetical protein
MPPRLISLVIPVVVAVAAMATMQCSKRPTEPEPKRPPYFPNTVGSQWVYEVHRARVEQDTLWQYRDTVTVTITDTARMYDTGMAASVWEYAPKYWGVTEGLYFTTMYGTVGVSPFDSAYELVNLYLATDSDIPYLRFQLPLEVGGTWPSDIWDCGRGGPPKVMADTTIDTPAGSFENCYEVFRSCSDWHGAVHLRDWVKPSIGVVRSVHFDSHSNKTNVWTLLDYKIVP